MDIFFKITLFLLLCAALTSGAIAKNTTPDNKANCFARATDTIVVDVNLDAYSRYIYGAPNNFVPSKPNTFNFSITKTAYDSLGNSLATRLYFVRQDPTMEGDEWSLFITINGVEVDIVGGPETGASGITGGELVFWHGNFVNQAPTPAAGGFVTEPLGIPGAGVLDPNADQTQTIWLDFNLDTMNDPQDEPTNNYAPFQLIAISQNGISLCM